MTWRNKPMSLQSILGDLPASQFLTDQYHRLPYSAAGKAASLCELGTWDALAAIVSQSHADTLVCRRNEQFGGSPPRSIEDARKLVNDGYTLLVRHAEQHDERLAALAAGFAADLGGAVNIHMYCTPGGQFGFGWHYDAEEVFIVQTTGRKEYLLRKNTVNPWPIEETLPADMHYEREIMPLMRCVLAAGDWLYIPSGYWHMGQSHETAISLAIGVQPRTAVELFDCLRPRILDSLLWRQRLPVMGDANPNGAVELEKAITEMIPQLAEDLTRLLSDPKFTDQYIANSRLCGEGSGFKTRVALGESWEQMGKLPEALAHYESAYRLNPNSNMTAVLLASVLRRLGRRSEAISVVGKVIDRSPTYGPARELLQSMESDAPLNPGP